ncbi:DNA helicase UvrD [Candidatus Berkelbacteria bacterium]|nr:DNA helicase UvrD [Candidatus Berkelbacteria bacterium]
MRLIADLHLHSKYSRATSKTLDVEGLYNWSKIKGIGLIGSADFTHPLWFAELKRRLQPLGNGLYQRTRDKKQEIRDKQEPLYILTSEISSIYSQGGKLRRIHNVILAPSLETVEEINKELGKRGNLYADGRPIFGISAHDLVKLLKSIDERIEIIPAHAWTPYFSLFGSMSGFDSIEECFGDQARHIHAIETGLSSDPLMNWRLSSLDHVAIVSAGDGHSGGNLMREATIFELEAPSYNAIIEAIRNSNAKTYPELRIKDEELRMPRIDYTIEFFPEEGKYHWDGHREHKVRLTPAQTKELSGICPKCQRPVTVGVEYRVDALADRSVEDAAKASGVSRPPFKKLVQLSQIISEALGKGEASQFIKDRYHKIISDFGNEYALLVDAPLSELEGRLDPRIIEGLCRVREGKISIEPGYDGEYGRVSVFKTQSEARSASSGQVEGLTVQPALL